MRHEIRISRAATGGVLRAHENDLAAYVHGGPALARSRVIEGGQR